MLGGDNGEVKRKVKRKLFEDNYQYTSLTNSKPIPKEFSPWGFHSVYRNDNSPSDSEQDEWQTVADSQETYSEFEPMGSSHSDSRGSFMSPLHVTYNYRPEMIPPHEQLENRTSTENNSNFTWLLNFKVESLFQIPWNHPVDHDHNYRSVPNECGTIPMEKQDLISEQFTTSQLLQKSRTKKPPYTYTELIELALKDKGELTVSGIYKWIMEHFPFFKATDDRWKNSVRHNLSINANFKKGRKAQGSSHLWTIATDTEKKRKQDLLNQTNKNHWKKRKLEELEKSFTLKAAYKESFYSSMNYPIKGENPADDRTPMVLSSPQTVTLAKSAEDILNGDVEKKVEVQLLTPLRPLAYTFLLQSPEFLNPVTRREVVQESGLLDEASAGEMVHSLPQQIFNSICSEIEPSGDLFEEELGYLNITP